MPPVPDPLSHSWCVIHDGKAVTRSLQTPSKLYPPSGSHSYPVGLWLELRWSNSCGPPFTHTTARERPILNLLCSFNGLVFRPPTDTNALPTSHCCVTGWGLARMSAKKIWLPPSRTRGPSMMYCSRRHNPAQKGLGSASSSPTCRCVPTRLSVRKDTPESAALEKRESLSATN